VCLSGNNILDETRYSPAIRFGALALAIGFERLIDGELNMKKLVLALAAMAAFTTGSASAADMAVKAPRPLPPPAPVYQWTGFWISGGFGYGLADIEQSTFSAVTIPPNLFDSRDIGAKGWLAKVGGGADYQFAGPFGSWVIGAFADAQWSDIKGQGGFFCPSGCSGPFNFNGQVKNDWSWAVGARLGYVALPGLLTYVNGGFTQSHWKQVNFADGDPTDTTFGQFTGLVQPSRTRDGWFVGGGTEYAITQLPGLFWKSEYRLAEYQRKDFSQLCIVAIDCGPAGTIHSINSDRTFVQTITTELVYRFNWGGPVAAKY
jgi:outer membrane immunogenic protein